MKHRVRRAVPEDEDGIMAFRRNYYQPGHKSLNRKYWRWKFRDHPFADEIPFFVIESEGQIVGTQGYWPMSIRSEKGKVVDCAQLFDFRVLGSFRGLPVVKLFRASCLSDGINFGSSLSEEARAFFRTARWVDMSDKVDELYYLLQLPPSGRSSFMDKIKYTVRRVEKRLKKQRVQLCDSQHNNFFVNNTPPIGIESLLQSNSLQSWTTCKDVSWLQWRYGQCPLCAYHYAALFEEDVLRAVLVFRVHLAGTRNICRIVDTFYAPDDGHFFLCLVSRFIDYCVEQDYTELETKVVGPVGGHFKRLGFGNMHPSLGLMFHSKNKKTMREFEKDFSFPFVIGDSDLW